METLPIHVFKDSFRPILKLLNEHEIKYQMRETRAGQVMAAGGVLEIILSPAMWGALATIVVAFIKYKNDREVIITMKDNKIIHAKGLTKAELELILKEAKNIAAIDTNKSDSDEKQT